MLESILFSVSVTGPIFLMLVVGFILRRLHWITDQFVQLGARLVFNLCLPVLLFLTISKANPAQALNLELMGAGVLVTLLGWGLLHGLAPWVAAPRDVGVVVQGGFRANMGIIGLAYCGAAYGQQGLVVASLYLALVTILFNVLSTLSLNWSLSASRGVIQQIKGVLRNPLIIGICLALPFSWWQWPLPAMVRQSGEYLAQLCLPLALLCAGASVSLKSFKADSGATGLACGAKLILMPVLAIAVGVWMDLSPMALGVLVMMASAPTASASYAMVRAMGGNAALAANVIAVTTVLGAISVSLTLSALRFLDLI